jgi:hypothetical protein
MNWQVGSGLGKKDKTGVFGTEPARAVRSAGRRRGEDLGIKTRKARRGKDKIEKAVVLTLVFLFSGFSQKVQAGPRGGSVAVIDAGSPTAFSFNEATVSSRNGISGKAMLYGTSVDGTRIKLSEAMVGFAESLTVTYYAWPELVSIAFEGTDGDGASLSASVRLRKSGSGKMAEGGAWNDQDAGMLAVFEFPVRLQTFGAPPRAITVEELAGAGQNQAARIAVARLFVTSRRSVTIMVLALWTIVVFAAASLSGKIQSGEVRRKADRQGKHHTVVLAAVLLAASAVTATTFTAGPAPAELFAVAVAAGSGSDADDRNTATPAPATEGTEARSSLLVRRVTSTVSYRSVSWNFPDEAETRTGGLWFMGIRSPQTAAVPVSALQGYRRLRFKTPPLVVTGPDGRAMLAPAPFMLAWGLHE